MTTYDFNKYSEYINYGGRIIYRNGEAILGYTLSYAGFKVKGRLATVDFRTEDNGVENRPGLRVYVDGKIYKEIVLDKPKETIEVYKGDDDKAHTVKILKITEAAMSFAGISRLSVDGELLPAEKTDDRLKVQFIGDSITCGFGVYAAPEAEYTIRDEDGELCYAGVLTKRLNLNAQFVSVSGYGMFVEYTGDPEGVVPRVYDYTNAFYDRDERIDHSEFEPDIIVVNLGTNDSGLVGDPTILHGFLSRYESFLYLLRKEHKNSAILCTIGTLAPGMYDHVSKVIEKVKSQGFEKIYGLELPFHDVEHDGVAAGHPTKITHEKDAKRLEDFLKNEGLI